MLRLTDVAVFPATAGQGADVDNPLESLDNSGNVGQDLKGEIVDEPTESIACSPAGARHALASASRSRQPGEPECR